MPAASRRTLTYEEVCSGRTGRTEVVRVIFGPGQVSYAQLLQIFFENHDPTQGMRQGGDIGTQYRSAIYTTSAAQKAAAEAALQATKQSCAQPATARSRRKSAMHRNFVTPRITTNNIWPRTRTAIAASAARG
jgi:methionine-S-sulfoxide reductase